MMVVPFWQPEFVDVFLVIFSSNSNFSACAAAACYVCVWLGRSCSYCQLMLSVLRVLNSLYVACRE